ncbi:hypothetical protein SBA4_2650011 [Candidatus Sulfopaludibacter sp. SbA4]|nr:hypothetical protein SBA4_2650011 [Candidatus Sulfopaludibacter sp. SbA4]
MTTKKRTSFNPTFTITPAVANGLMRIEAVKQAIQTLPITPRVLANLRETARLFSTHYSTMIEGNRLTQEEVAQVIGGDRHFPGRERDQDEVKGYYAALDEAERLAKRHEKVSEATVQRLHALVMGGGKTRVKSTPYRDGQNVIRDAHSKGIVYMPPEAKDVPWLMGQLITWINQKDELPVPLKAGIAHYEYATILEIKRVGVGMLPAVPPVECKRDAGRVVHGLVNRLQAAKDFLERDLFEKCEVQIFRKPVVAEITTLQSRASFGAQRPRRGTIRDRN